MLFVFIGVCVTRSLVLCVCFVLLTLPEHLSSPMVFGGVRVAASLVFCVVWLLLFLYYLVAVVLSVLPRLTNSDYPFGIFWPLYFLSFLDLRLMITHLVSSGHCIVCPSSIYDFWLSLWYLVAIVLSVLLRYIRILITPLVSSNSSCNAVVLAHPIFFILATALLSTGFC